ncbi:MAG TPA: alpha-glucan family phosphorylase [Geminicoccaceae bacterium]|nr:alpha-glucan family phosphorylase [Geminicoccaceae bacterium]
MTPLDPFLRRTRVAYFSMEIALRPEIHTYSGGLGMLAGDTARSCADLEMPVVFVTLISRAGYLRQEISPEGRQIDQPDPWEPEEWATPLGAKIVVEVEGREVWVRPWLYQLEGGAGYRVPVLLLDADLDENAPEDRRLTDRLYGGDDVYRLKQEMLLGLGGVRLLRSLGFEIQTYHLNEGHSALLTLELLKRHRLAPEMLRPGDFAYDTSEVRGRCVFTTHTPVDAGHDRFPYPLVERVLGEVIDYDQLRTLAGSDSLNMTRLALSLSGFVNGVAERHAETAHRMFPAFRVRAITNGVHPPTWTHASFARLYQAHFPHWQHEPELLVRADQLPDDAVWAAHARAKQALVARVQEIAGVALDPELPLLGFARRMTGYKRPELLFSDLDRLRAIARRHPFQIVLAGKAHPRDLAGKQTIERLHGHIRELAGAVPAVFLPNYDMALARDLVAGADLWLNTPLPPLEASGTSGMKATLNGVLNFSVLDGWWLEGCIEGRTGWAIGDDAGVGEHGGDARDLYAKLEVLILPLYHGDRARWIWMMKEAIGKIASYFNSQRMMRRYASEAYFR